MEWKPYLRGREIAEHPAGFVIVRPSDREPPIPLACPVCSCLLRNIDDEQHFSAFGCCEYCANRWAYAHADEWREGWRPPRDDVEASLGDRPPIVMRFVES